MFSENKEWGVLDREGSCALQRSCKASHCPARECVFLAFLPSHYEFWSFWLHNSKPGHFSCFGAMCPWKWELSAANPSLLISAKAKCNCLGAVWGWVYTHRMPPGLAVSGCRQGCGIQQAGTRPAVFCLHPKERWWRWSCHCFVLSSWSHLHSFCTEIDPDWARNAFIQVLAAKR